MLGFMETGYGTVLARPKEWVPTLDTMTVIGQNSQDYFGDMISGGGGFDANQIGSRNNPLNNFSPTQHSGLDSDYFSQVGGSDDFINDYGDDIYSSAFGKDLDQFNINYDSNLIERSHAGNPYDPNSYLLDAYALDYGVGPDGEAVGGGIPARDWTTGNVVPGYSSGADLFNPEQHAGRLVQDNFAGTNALNEDKNFLQRWGSNIVEANSPQQAAALSKRRQEGYSDTFMPVPYSSLFEEGGFNKPFSYFDENPNIVDGQPTNRYDGGNMATFNDRYTDGAAPFRQTTSDAARYKRFYDSLGTAGMGNDLMNRELESQRESLAEIQGVRAEIESGIISMSVAPDPNDLVENGGSGSHIPVTIRGGKILSYEHIDDFTARMQWQEKSVEDDIRSITNQSSGDPIAYAGQVGPHEAARAVSGPLGQVLDKAGDVLFRVPGWLAGQALDKTGMVLGKLPFVGDTLEGLFRGGGDAVTNLGSNLDHTLGGLPQTFIDRPSQMIRGGLQSLQGNPAGMLNMKNAGGNFLNETLGRTIDLGRSAVDLAMKPLVESGLNLNMNASAGVRPGGGGGSGKASAPKSSKPQVGRGSIGGSSRPVTPGSGMVRDGAGNSHNLNTAEGQLSFQKAMGPSALKGALAASGLTPRISISPDGSTGIGESDNLFADVPDSDKSTVYEDFDNTGAAGEMSVAKSEASEKSKTQKLYEELGFPELANA